MKNIHGGDIYQYNNILDFSANINPLGAPQSDHLRKWSGGRDLSVCVCGKTEENSGDGTLLCGV